MQGSSVIPPVSQSFLSRGSQHSASKSGLQKLVGKGGFAMPPPLPWVSPSLLPSLTFLKEDLDSRTCPQSSVEMVDFLLKAQSVCLLSFPPHNLAPCGKDSKE